MLNDIGMGTHFQVLMQVNPLLLQVQQPMITNQELLTKCWKMPNVNFIQAIRSFQSSLSL
jgi:hypothetical protein